MNNDALERGEQHFIRTEQWMTSFLSILLLVVLCHDVAAQQTVSEVEQTNAPIATASSSESGSLKFQFSEAAWPDVLRWFADEAGLALDMTNVPDGTFNYVDNESHTVREAIDILNGYLLPRGVVLLRRDQFLVSIATDDPNLANMVPTISLEELAERGENELLRIAVPLSGFELGPVAEQLRGILGAKGVALPVDSSDSIVLQGFGNSLRTAVELIRRSVAPPSDEKLTFRSFPLRHIAVGEAERQIQSLIGLGQNPFQASMMRRQREYDRRSRGRDDNEEREDSSPNPLVANLAMNMKVSSLRHTNSLLVTATPAGVELIEQMLESIDVPSVKSPDTLFAMGGPVLRVYTVDNADEDDVAETIESVIPGVVINEDGRNNSIHIFATEEEHREVETLINTIDSGGIGDGVEVISLTRSNPAEITGMLEQLFSNEDRDDRPSISPGLRTRSIVVRGTSAQLGEIRKALASLGEGPDAVKHSMTGGGPVRRLRVGDKNRAKRIASFVKELLQDDSQYGDSVRVITPDATIDGDQQPSIIRRDRSDQRNSDTMHHRPRFNNREAFAPSDHRMEAKSRSSESDLASVIADIQTDANILPTSFTRFQVAESPMQSQRFVSDQYSRNPITIEIEGDDILMYSDDETALDEIESIIRDLIKQLPSRKQWNVFYLRAAPADVTAQTLVDLLRANNFTETYLGVGPEYELDSGIPTTMRIVPDARTNALFISGPSDQVDRAAELIRFLDTTDLPASLRDRLPRTIELQYADATTIAGLVRELFKDLLVDPNAVRRSSRDRDRDDDRDDNDEVSVVSATPVNAPGLRPSGIQLTVAVDENANALLVACNDQIFEQIKSVVAARDQAAKENEPVTSVISVSPAIAPYLQNMLLQDQPQVRTTNESERQRQRGRSRNTRPGRD
ncbi:secretin N-terminal domain-containing protein [Aporhodopirellula aestuarii]|uniref:NolW-like domain-containing protein n=1 Tax=Aporhodopirellula aestuarii TaxID=2950107 RepID=A0ABT0U388_9BACT|nr:secretin N-terminal domain-containing protein [Aporhodopirellula aestuarii]MCM2370943.1 hypothetical protein [Aporhodopirellula aestuarii]